MKPFNKVEYVKTELIGLENQIVSSAQRGATSLSVYLENFCAKILEIYYGYKFQNLNYESKNIEGVDLYNSKHKHAIQITSERNNSKKIEKSIKNHKKYNKLTVFFFDHNKTTTIAKHVKDKGEWVPNLEVISLYDVLSDIETNVEKIEQYYELCRIWIGDNRDLTQDIILSINDEMLKKVEANKKSKKYIPEIYIPEIKLKQECRRFVLPSLAKNELFILAKTFYEGSKHKNLKETIITLKNGETLKYTSDCDINELLDKTSIEDDEVDLLIAKLENYEKLSSSLKESTDKICFHGEELIYDESVALIESSVNYAIKYALKDFFVSRKFYYFIVKDAGQGKTSFLCDFSENVLAKRKIPTIYINVNQLSETLLSYFQNIITSVLKSEYLDAMQLLKNYLSTVNRKLIVLIDGLNETTKGVGFKNELLSFINHIDNYGFIKMIATTRNVAYETYYKDFENEAFADKIQVDIERIYGTGERKSPKFKTELLKKYKEYFNVSCYISKSAIKKLVNDTLLLRIFCEVYSNNSTDIVNNIFLDKLFSAYITRRANQLLCLGKIKRIDDLKFLLMKIAKQMIDSDNLNDFQPSSFNTEEKDLLDLIVEEDILIKTIDKKDTMFFDYFSSFSFTYDEFRDYLLASSLLHETSVDFQAKVENMDLDFPRYDGLLKYIFLFCKKNKDKRLLCLEKLKSYNEIYSSNIFQIEDEFLDKKDVAIIKNAIENEQQGVYYEVCKRLNLVEYRNISVLNIVDHYISHYQRKDPEWQLKFAKINIYTEAVEGILPDLLNEKIENTHVNEVEGILMLLCTFKRVTCNLESDYLKWLYSKYEVEFNRVLEQIKTTRPELVAGCEKLKREVEI